MTDIHASHDKDAAPTELARTALLFCTDLMFGVELQSMARKAGFCPVTIKPGVDLPEAAILVVDLRAQGDWESAIRTAVSRQLLVVAFGPHVDTEGRQKAKAAGASRVLSNGRLARDLPLILKEI